MHLVTRETTLVGFKSLPLNWGSWQSTERIETFELQTAVITEKFVQTRNLENHQGIVIAALNARTLTSRAPHTSYQPLNSRRSALSSLKNSTRGRLSEEARKEMLANQTKARQTILF